MNLGNETRVIASRQSLHQLMANDDVTGNARSIRGAIYPKPKVYLEQASSRRNH